MQMIHLPEVRSTNTWMFDHLAKGDDMADETVVYTLRQTAGRGQMGNSWESEPDKNISFSMLLCPEFLPIREQFIISQLCSLAIVEALDELICEQLFHDEVKFSIKWPNDIYAGDRKLCGILIENRLMGSTLKHCVLGVGINVNQEKWIGNAPNPVSLKMLGIETDPVHVLKIVAGHIHALYEALRDNREMAAVIRERYMQRLYRKEGYYAYYDPAGDDHFDARIVGVDAQGPLLLRLTSGEVRKYWFKEVRFVLPCGVTKE